MRAWTAQWVVEARGADVVEVGCSVVVRDGNGRTMMLELSNFGARGDGLRSSPLGVALMGPLPGERVEVQAKRVDQLGQRRSSEIRKPLLP